MVHERTKIIIISPILMLAKTDSLHALHLKVTSRYDRPIYSQEVLVHMPYDVVIVSRRTFMMTIT